jgi:hypothetical protein
MKNKAVSVANQPTNQPTNQSRMGERRNSSTYSTLAKSAARCQRVGPSVDPFRPDLSNYLFNVCPLFLVPVGYTTPLTTVVVSLHLSKPISFCSPDLWPFFHPKYHGSFCMPYGSAS